MDAITCIQSSYDEYISRYPDESMISVGGTGLPLKESVKNNTGGIYETNVSAVERDCLFTYSDSLPDVDSLSIPELERLAVSLTRPLQAQITDDHHQYWELSFKTFQDVNREYSVLDRRIWKSVEYVFHLCLVDEFPIGKSHSDIVLKDSRRIAPYVAYPALEGLLKSYSRPAITTDGEVQIPNRIVGLKRGDTYPSGKQCSSLLDLLYYIESKIGNYDSELQNNLQSFRQELADLADISPTEVYGLLYSWRNSTAHGQPSPDVQYGVVLNLICLLIWAKVRRKGTEL